ncbi:MAG: hypothetical protein IPH94_02885 [Saprospiraceae bacterium]|nr:hypothetical protein [Saprospiraceae bacterium]MBK8109682.1 hypothetical protein [Saprospiraceae bacterium]
MAKPKPFSHPERAARIARGAFAPSIDLSAQRVLPNPLSINDYYPLVLFNIYQKNDIFAAWF